MLAMTEKFMECKGEIKMSEELKFANEEEALQHLSDYTGKKILIAVNDEIPNYLYHATYKPLMEKIKEQGLRKDIQKKIWEDSKNLIYLAVDKHIAESYAETSELVPEEWLDEIVILKISRNDLDLTKLEADENIRSDEISTYQYSDNIPFSKIEIV